MTHNGKLGSERVVVSAPMSFAGSAQRLWRMTEVDNAAVKWALVVPLALVLVMLVWCAVLMWYLVFGLLVVPFRVFRRGSRKRKIAARQHRETLEALGRATPARPDPTPRAWR